MRNKRWLVDSGDMLRTVWGSDPADALRVALMAESASEDVAALGEIASVIEITPTAEIYYCGVGSALEDIERLAKD